MRLVDGEFGIAQFCGYIDEIHHEYSAEGVYSRQIAAAERRNVAVNFYGPITDREYAQGIAREAAENLLRAGF